MQLLTILANSWIQLCATNEDYSFDTLKATPI